MFHEYKEFFFNRLIQLRASRKVSARDMSLTMGQGQGYINNIENKKNLPSMTGFFYICDYFNVTPKEYFDDGVQCPEKVKTLIEDLSALNDEQLDTVHAVVRGMKK